MSSASASKQSGHFVHPRPPNGFVWVEGVAPLSVLSSSSSTAPSTHVTGKFLPPLVRIQPTAEGASSMGSGMLSGSGAPSGLVSGLGDGFGYDASSQPFSPHARLVLHLADAVTFAGGGGGVAATIGKGGSVPPGTILWEEAPICVFPDTFDSLRSLLPKDSSTPTPTPTTTPPAPLDGQKAFLQRLAAVWKLGTEGNNKGGDEAQQAAIKAFLGTHTSRGYSALSYCLAGYASQRESTITASSPSKKSEVEDVEIDTLNLFNGLPLLLGCSPNPTTTSPSQSLLHAAFSHYFGRSGYSASRPTSQLSTSSSRDPVAALVGLGSMSAKCLDVLTTNTNGTDDANTTHTPSLAALWCPILMYLAQHRSLSLFSFQLAAAPTTPTNNSSGAPSSSGPPGGGAGKASEILRRKLLERDVMNGKGGGNGDKKGDVSKRISAFFPLSSMAAYVRMTSTANVAIHLHWITSEGDGEGGSGGGAKYRVVLRAVASKTIAHGETIKLPASLLASSCMNPPPPPPSSSKSIISGGGEVPLLTPSAIGAGLCSNTHLDTIKGLYTTLAKSLAQLGGEGSLTTAALAAYILPAPPTFLPSSLYRPTTLPRTPTPYRMYPTRLPNTVDPFSSPPQSEDRESGGSGIDDDKSIAAAYNLATSKISKDTMDANATMATTRAYQVAEGIVMMLSQGNFFNTLYGDQLAARKASSLLSLVSKHVEQQQKAGGGSGAPIAAIQQPNP